MRSVQSELSKREYEEWQHEREVWEATAAHQIALKQLDLDLARLEAKWSSWLRIPLTIIKLPVYLLFGVAFIMSVIVKYDLPEDFWRFLK